MQRIKNPDLENGDWQGRIAWEEESAPILRQNIHVEFNMNDPHMLFEVVDEETLSSSKCHQRVMKYKLIMIILMLMLMQRTSVYSQGSA
jgi:hypothetical protein